MAAGENFMSAGFCLKYAGIIFLLGIYAIGWQQIIKYLPLTTAYANKAVTIVWGIVWGFIFFHEHLSYGKIIGALIIIIGIVMFVYSDVNSKRGADKP
ncbi:transporter [Butyrivibrio sp. VCB2006]|uniref:transporter n=1 Tax=Butyrivibrio sp. VCB2006 TaxID=1280679 RepID=UPI001FA73E54|nr:transporter [Butyrivibrio sp. VCB2006]